MSNLMHARKTKNITQTELGEMLGGVPKTNISAWEKGKRSIPEKYHERLKEILGVSDLEIQRTKTPSDDTSCLSQKYILKLEQYITLLEKYIALLENNAKKGAIS